MDAEQPATLTLRDAGRILGVGPEQVRRLIASGQLRSLRQPGSRGPHLVTARDVQQLSEVRGPRDRTVHHLARAVADLEARLDGALRGSLALHQEEVRQLADLRAENSRLKDSEARLAVAAEAEREANRALRKALRAQHKANRLQADAEEASARAAEEYAAALRNYRIADTPNDALGLP